MGQVIIAGFSSTDRVPGFYGETKYGVTASSASSIPLQLLLVGLKNTAGTATANQDINQIFATSDADTFYGPGSELARMCYAALKTPGVSIWGAPVTAAGGAAAASIVVTFTGTWTTVGTYYYRINGETRSITIGSTDTVTNVAANLVADINSVAKWPVTAANVSGAVTITHKTAGARGSNQIYFQDVSRVPAGAVATISGSTALNTANPNGGFLAGGTGAESVSTLLTIIATTQYDRIAIAQQDSTALGLWKTQVDSQAGPTTGITQHVVFGTNGTYSSAQGLSATTVNDQRFQQVWSIDNEQNPLETAAAVAAMRTAAEQADPNAMYDDFVVPGCPAQALKQDWPSHATLVSAINNGITPLYSTSDGYCRISRSIVTHCQTGGVADYSTLDTGDAVVPDYVRLDLRLYWVGTFKVNNPRNADDPPPGGRPAPSGVATPSIWNASVVGKLRDYEAGKNFPAPIIINVDQNPPYSTYDPIAKRIMSAVTVVPAPGNHQIGCSVRQSST